MIWLLALTTTVFFSAYLWPNSSLYMVRLDTGRLVAVTCLLGFVASFACHVSDKLVRRGVSMRVGVACLVIGAGSTFLSDVFDTTAGGLILYSGAVCLCFAAYWRSKGKLDGGRIALLIVVMGCVMRIAFAMSMPAYAHQHDTDWGDSFWTAGGHGEYVAVLYETWALPQDNGWQLYHPPLFHFLAALLFGLNLDLLGNGYHHGVENLQFLTALFSCITLVYWDKILYELRCQKLAHLLALSLLAFHPTFYFVGACVNNDMLLWMLVSMTVHYLIRWMKEPVFRHLLPTAACLGLGMMAKVSAVLLAPVMACVFLQRLVYSIRTRDGTRPLLAQYAVFALVSIPLGMWYPVRNLLRFGQGFSHVPEPAGVDADQYIGGIPLLERLLPVNLSTLSTPYVVWDNDDANILIKTVKTSLFAERFEPTWSFARDTAAVALTVAAYLLVLLSLAAIVYVLVRLRGRRTNGLYWMLAGLWLVQTASYVYFCIQYPWQCTIDARYVVLNICIGAVFLGRMSAALLSPRRGAAGRRALAGRCIGYLTVGAAALFVAGSCLIFVSEAFLHIF